jgi:hypothetical protein
MNTMQATSMHNACIVHIWRRLICSGKSDERWTANLTRWVRPVGTNYRIYAHRSSLQYCACAATQSRGLPSVYLWWKDGWPHCINYSTWLLYRPLYPCWIPLHCRPDARNWGQTTRSVNGCTSSSRWGAVQAVCTTALSPALRREVR